MSLRTHQCIVALSTSASIDNMTRLLKMLQSVAVQQQLLKLGVLDWILREIAMEPARQVQLILPDIADLMRSNALVIQQASPSAPDAAAESSAGSSHHNEVDAAASPPKVTFDAVVAADSNREGAVYYPPGPASPSAAVPGSVLAQQLPTRLPLRSTHLQPQAAVRSPVHASKSPPAKEDDEGSLADSFRDENRPLSSNSASPRAVEQEAETEESLPAGFVLSGDMEEDFERLCALDPSSSEVRCMFLALAKTWVDIAVSSCMHVHCSTNVGPNTYSLFVHCKLL